MRKIIRLCFWTILCFPGVLSAQATPQDTVPQEEVQVDHADLFEYQRSADSTLQKLIGNVALTQDSVYMYCDSALIRNRMDVTAMGQVIIQQGDSLHVFSDSLVYDGRQRLADLYGDVVLVNRGQKLFTTHLTYDLNTKVATYFETATLTDSTSQLTSKRGYYYVEERVAYFKDSVVVVDDKFSLRADTLKFNTATKVVEFLGPTLVKNDSIKVYCEAGFYDTENNVAEFEENAQFQKNNQQAEATTIRYDGLEKTYLLIGNARFFEDDKRAGADTIRYDEKNDRTFLIGNATYRDKEQDIAAEQIIYDGDSDTYTTKGRSIVNNPPQILEADHIAFSETSGMGIAMGHVIWQDTAAHVTILCDSANYNQQTEYLKAIGGTQGRPLLLSEIEEDTLFLAADTLFSMKLDTLETDSSRLLIGYPDVRVYKRDLQAICDSLVYNSQDSIFRFYRQPIMWSDTSQFSADTVSMKMKDDQIDRIFLNSNGLIVNSPDEIFYNQIQGKFITAFFEAENLRRMEVEGNAESVYYALDEEKAYIGVNKAICSEMILFFGDNQIEKITFLAEPKANLYPMQQAKHEELKLEGFFWEQRYRPTNVEDLFSPHKKRSASAFSIPVNVQPEKSMSNEQ